MCKQISNLLLSPLYSDFVKSESERVNTVRGEADIALVSWGGFDQLSDRVAGISWLIRFVAGLSPLCPSVSSVIVNLRGKGVAGAGFSSRISGFLWTLKLALFEAARYSLTHRGSTLNGLWYAWDSLFLEVKCTFWSNGGYDPAVWKCSKVL